MNLETRIAKLETRQGSCDDSDPFAVRLGRWLATAPRAAVERDCRSNPGLLELANRLRELSPVELAAELDAAREDDNVLARVRSAA
ncbi:MAG: hypothetical protein RKP73_10050 [Candidatus Contendobacter sp.]|nr:hypothetical protein [Candidatus Contendobacter sp.]